MGGPCRPDFPKSTITAGPRTTHYAAQGHRANIVFSLEMEREEGEGGGSWPPPQRRRPLHLHSIQRGQGTAGNFGAVCICV